MLGADAIYMGINKFNARNMAENFDIDSYINAIEYAHQRGIKVYLTLNTLLKTDEINEALDIVTKLYSKGLDAVIVQDIGLARLIHEIMPKLHLHASTQMSVYSLSQVRFLEKIGFKRVVLARELSLEEIEYICKNTNLEIEVFVHGALCVSLSGQCLLSSVIGNRSANRGECAQPCRMKYSLYDKTDKEIVRNKYLLSKKDIFGLEYLGKLLKAGVTSFKIEGRNKTPEYVYGVTRIYRKYMDNIINSYRSDYKIDDKDKFVLKQLFNRDGLDTGYLGGVRYKSSISLKSPKNTGVYIGKVIEKYKKFVKVEIEEDIDMHDGIEIYCSDNIVSNVITCIKDNKGNIINKGVKKGSVVYIGDFSGNIKKGDKIYRTTSSALNKNLRLANSSKQRKRKLNISISIKRDKNIKVYCDELTISYEIEHMPEDAKNRATSIIDLEKAFSKTQDTPFEFKIDNADLDENVFVPLSILNELRRGLIEKIKKYYTVDLDYNDIEKKKETILKKWEVTFETLKKTKYKEKRAEQDSLFIYKYNSQKDYLKEYSLKYGEFPKIIYFDVISFIKYKDEILKKYNTDTTQVYLYISNFTLKNLNKIIEDNLENYVISGVKGIMLGSFCHYELCKKLKDKYNIKLVADYTFNISNKYSANLFHNFDFDLIVPSVELSIEDIKELDEYFNISLNLDIITVMTSRYCILGSFIGRKDDKSRCTITCKDTYHLKDTHGANYYIICDNIDCVMRIVKYRKKEEYEKLSVNKRHAML